MTDFFLIVDIVSIYLTLIVTKTYIFVNGHVECVCGATGNSYKFDISLPPKPSPDAELRTPGSYAYSNSIG